MAQMAEDPGLGGYAIGPPQRAQPYIVSSSVSRRIQSLYRTFDGASALPSNLILSEVTLPVDGVADTAFGSHISGTPARPRAVAPDSTEGAPALPDYVVWLSRNTCKQLCIRQGSWVLVTHSSSAFAAPGSVLALVQLRDASAGIAVTLVGSQGAIEQTDRPAGAILSPLAAYQLGVQYALAPLLTRPMAASTATASSCGEGESSQMQAAAQLLGQVTVAVVGPHTIKLPRPPSPTTAQPAMQQPANAVLDQPSSAALSQVPVAQTVELSKVARPMTGPLERLLAGAGAQATPLQDQQEPASESEAAASSGLDKDSNHGQGSSHTAMDRASEALRQYFTACPRYVPNALIVRAISGDAPCWYTHGHERV